MEREIKLSMEILYHSKEKCLVMSGGDPNSPSWEEYVNEYREEYRTHFYLIKEALEKAGHIGETGEGMQRLGITFKFSDGEHWSFSWRGWGDLMQAIVNKREGYMKYYM